MGVTVEYAQYVVNGLTTGAIYVLVAVGLSLVFGVLDTVNFAHGEFYMVGAYLAFVLIAFGLPVVIAVPLAALGGAAVGAIAEALVFRPTRGTAHINAMVASMGLSIVMTNGALMIFSPTPRRLAGIVPQGVMSLWGIGLSYNRLIIVVVALILVALLYLLIDRTWLGLAMRATSQDLKTSLLMGVKLNNVATAAFAIAGGLAAVAGVLVGPLFIVEPYMGVVMVLKAFVIVIAGGIGNLAGVVGAGFLLGIAESVAAAFVGSGFKELIAFCIMILVLLVRPEGLAGSR